MDDTISKRMLQKLHKKAKTNYSMREYIKKTVNRQVYWLKSLILM